MTNQNIVQYIRYIVGIFLLIILQQTFIQYTEIYHFAPDVVLIGLFVIAVRLGQIPATVFGFTAGLVTDLFVGEMIGISALAKTVGAFIAGYYFDEEKIKITIRTPRFILITVICTFVHNIIYIFAYLRSVDLDIFKLFLTYGIGSTIYTSIISTLAVLIVAKVEQKIKLP